MNNMITKNIFQKLKALQKENNGLIDLNHIDELIKQFLVILNSNALEQDEQEVCKQIDLISARIAALKRDVTNVSAEVLHDQFIPNIITELRSVIIQTEKSVTNILDLSDEITNVAQQITDPSIREELFIRITRILEICSFQDLTGQKIQRIIHHLGETESIIHKMLHALKPEAHLKYENNYEKSLLKGPQDEKVAPSQSAIDDIFSSS